MAIILPFAGFLLLIAVFRQGGSGRRGAVVHASVVFGLHVVLLTELLSLPGMITKTNLAIGWLLLDLSLALICLGPKKRLLAKSEIPPSTKSDELKWTDRLLLAGSGLVGLLSLTVTLIAPPNHGDVMSYHLPRIVMWLQNRSVAFYPTNDGRQLHQPPGAEYAMMHLHALASGDRFVGLIQWAGFVLSALVVSLIVERLGGGKRLQIIAAAFCLTMPQSIVMAPSGKNDCVVGFLIAAFVYYLIMFSQKEEGKYLVAAGVSAGMALLTKGTAYFFLPPLCLVLVAKWRWSGWRRKSAYLALALAAAALINSPQWGRNAMLIGSPVGSDNEWGTKYAIEPIGPRTTYASVLKNLAVHLGTPVTVLNQWIESGIVRLVALSGTNVNDPGTNWWRGRFYLPSRPGLDSYAGNPWHLMMIFLTILFLLLARDRRELPWELSLGLILAFVFFCAVLRWQGNISRFHIPLFVVWAAPVVIVLGRKLNPNFLVLTLLLLLAPAYWRAVSLQRQSMLPGSPNNIFTESRMHLYFAHYPQLRDPYLKAVDAVKESGCRRIAFVSELDEFEYPIIAGLGGETGTLGYQYVHILHPSRLLAPARPAGKVCAVICPKCWGDWIEEYRKSVDRSLQFDSVSVFFTSQGRLP